MRPGRYTVRVEMSGFSAVENKNVTVPANERVSLGTITLAVGGITVARMAEVARTGASGIAAIGLFGDSAAERLQVVVREAALAFDTP